MRNIFKTIKRAIARNTETTEKPIEREICLKCKSTIGNDSEYMNFCQECGEMIDEIIEGLDMNPNRVMEDEIVMQRLSQWRW